MSGNHTKPALKWRLECLGHSVLEGLAALLPGPWVFRLGECLGTALWPLLKSRRRAILRNLRIAYAGEKSLPELHQLARLSFRRSAANLMSAAHTARLNRAQLARVLEVENLELLEKPVAEGRGVVLLLAHIGNWEILSRLVHFFPPSAKAGAFYRPLNNQLLDARILARRQADGTRMFAKRDNPLHVAGFLRDRGVVGILADQRVGSHGEPVRFFGRVTNATPLPGLLARRAKAEVLALSLTTLAPGRWRASFQAVERPYTTAHCMAAVERVMAAAPVDVFWLQERWKVHLRRSRPLAEALRDARSSAGKHHRALVWMEGAPVDWRLPDNWLHPDVRYEVAGGAAEAPSWLPSGTRVHPVAAAPPAAVLAQIDAAAVLPVDFMVVAAAGAAAAAARRAGIPVICLP